MGDCLATIYMGRREGAAVPLSGDELGPRLTQCRLGRGLSPHQVAYWSNQPFDHNRRGPKIGWLCPLVEIGSAPNIMSPGQRSTCLPSGILIDPAVWPQQTWAEKWGWLCPFPWGSWVPI